MSSSAYTTFGERKKQSTQKIFSQRDVDKRFSSVCSEIVAVQYIHYYAASKIKGVKKMHVI